MQRLLPIILLGLALGAGIWLGAKRDPAAKVVGPTMKLHFIDVGQGDCILIESPDGKRMLIDAGNEDSADAVISYLERKEVSHLDFLAISHPHRGHIGGVPAVLDHFEVGHILDSGYSDGSRLQQRVLDKIEQNNLPYLVAHEGQHYQLGKDVQIEILGPPRKLFKNTSNDAHNNSLVVRVSYGNISAILTGGIAREAESALVASRKNIESSILKIARHGANDSTSVELLRLVRPGIVVISCGAGKEQEPHKATLERVSPDRLGAKLFRTDRNGTIVVTTDGRKAVAEAER